MKKLLALMMAITLCLSFAGCESDSPSDVTAQATISTTSDKNNLISNTSSTSSTNVTTSTETSVQPSSTSSSNLNIPKDEITSKSTTTTRLEKTTTVNIQPNSATVYITATGKKYHSTKSCSGLSNAKAIYDSTLSAAISKGLEPCSKCH